MNKIWNKNLKNMSKIVASQVPNLITRVQDHMQFLE